MEQRFREILARNIKVERARCDLTQEQLADLADVSTKHITKIEKARVTPSAFLVFKIAKVLKVTIDKLTTQDV